MIDITKIFIIGFGIFIKIILLSKFESTEIERLEDELKENTDEEDKLKENTDIAETTETVDMGKHEDGSDSHMKGVHPDFFEKYKKLKKQDKILIYALIGISGLFVLWLLFSKMCNSGNSGGLIVKV